MNIKEGIMGNSNMENKKLGKTKRNSSTIFITNIKSWSTTWKITNWPTPDKDASQTSSDNKESI
jgi:hypothetical protein